jgi:hypothetical protein
MRLRDNGAARSRPFQIREVLDEENYISSSGCSARGIGTNNDRPLYSAVPLHRR